MSKVYLDHDALSLAWCHLVKRKIPFTVVDVLEVAGQIIERSHANGNRFKVKNQHYRFFQGYVEVEENFMAPSTRRRDIMNLKGGRTTCRT